MSDPIDFRATLTDEEWETFWVPVAVAESSEAAIATVRHFVDYHGCKTEYDSVDLDVTIEPVWMRDTNPEDEFGWQPCDPTDDGATALWKVSS